MLKCGSYDNFSDVMKSYDMITLLSPTSAHEPNPTVVKGYTTPVHSNAGR